MKAMKIFTINRGSRERAEVESFKIKNGNVKIPAVMVGESGRGRKLGVLPVQLTPENYNKWQAGEKVNILAAQIGETKNGRPKLVEADASDASDTSAIVVLRTTIGFRGSNDHTGDILKSWWELDEYFIDKAKSSGVPTKGQYTTAEKTRYTKLLQQFCVGFDDYEDFFIEKSSYQKFPGEVICSGRIAQGDAGRMGSGEQLIAIIPKNTVFCTAYTGRLYGESKQHFYMLEDGNILFATQEERTITDIF